MEAKAVLVHVMKNEATHAHEKFVVTKGVNGWGDRLQCLLKAIGYARKTGRGLVVDWRDSDWTHDPDEPIEKWFSFEGVKTTPLAEFLDIFKKNQESITVFPPVWKPEMETHHYDRLVYKKAYYEEIKNDRIAEITAGAPDHKEDVVVCPGVGNRTFSYSDFGAIKPSPWLKEQIMSATASLGIKGGRYDVVHLRGGSKPWAGGVVNLKPLEERILRAWPTRESYIDDIHARYLSSTRDQEALDVLVITDSASLGRDWILKSGVGRLVPTFNEHIESSGTHKIRKESLLKLGSNKESLNVEVMRDFCIMLNARRLVGDGVSTFSKTAEKCRARRLKFVDL